MNTNVEQLLAAVLADMDQIQTKLDQVTVAVAEVGDTLEASRISLGALRDAVRGA